MAGVLFRLFALALSALCLPAGASAADRFALLIGNSRYEAATPLRNPENDIEIVAEALGRSGFATTKLANADAAAMSAALDDFVRDVSASENPVVMLYFAGHGVQLEGENYLLPVDAKLGSGDALKAGALSLGDLARRLDRVKSRLQMIVLDSCRDDPFEEKTRGLRRGLADAPETLGRLVAFSTSPGTVATDGDSGASPYASAFAEAVTIPGLALEDVFKRVRATVKERTAGKQEPWENSAIYGDFRFVEAEQTTSTDADEIAFFEFASLADSQEAYRKYLGRYPEGLFASLARRKIEFMDKDFSFRRQSETFRKFAFRMNEVDFCKRVGFVNSFAEGRPFPDDNEIILIDLYYEYHIKVCPNIGYFGADWDAETNRTAFQWATASAYGETYANFPKVGVIDGEVKARLFPEADSSLFVYKIFDDGLFTLSVPKLDPARAAFFSYNSCISSCVQLTALVRTKIRSDEESTAYSFELVDAAELGVSWKYQNTLSRADAPAAEQELASARIVEPAPPARIVDEVAAAPFRTARDIAGWSVVAVVADGGQFRNCRAHRPQRGEKLAFFRMYPGGGLSFGYYDPASSHDSAYSGYAGYLLDGQTGDIVPIRAYSRQELAYDLGKEPRTFDRLKAGHEIEAAKERTSLAGSRQMLQALESCVRAFGG